MTLFADKYRVESARLRWWDYAAAGWYFVTICTRNREFFFGKIADAIVQLSAIGEIVVAEWLRTETQRPDVTLDKWVVMPNHIHGIIILKGDACDKGVRKSETIGTAAPGTETSQRNVSTGQAGGRSLNGNTEMWGPGTRRLQPNSLGSIVGQFKGASTKAIWAAGFRDFGWQARYYDHVIRGPQSLDRIRAYIRANPIKWATDEYNPTVRTK